MLAFLDSLQRRGAGVRVGTLATSVEGRRVPWVVASRPLVGGPGEAHRTGKPVVWLQANIHAGEVEGKEAAQMLLRDLTLGPLRPLLDSLVLVVVPIYNTDGNERWAPGDTNRPGQNGPAVVGRNENGQGLNLNRDYVKMEAPETRGAAAMLEAWDPDVFIDLHTTNGSYHGYALTYAPGLNSNGTPARDFARDRLLPAVRERMRRRHGTATFPYGNFRNQDPDSLAAGWETYDARPRFGTNWMGLRGRVAVLSEGYSNADFRTRVTATYDFVHEVLSYAAEQRGRCSARSRRPAGGVRIRWPCARSWARPPARTSSPRSPGPRGKATAATPAACGAGSTVPSVCRSSTASSPPGARPCRRRISCRRGSMTSSPCCGGRASRSVGSSARGPVRPSGSAWTRCWSTPCSRATGRCGRKGAGTRRTRQAEAGSYVVSTDQPLGLLAAYLLEPASEDGIVTWNLLDRELAPRAAYPILRSRQALHAPAVELPYP